jgi:N-methylhydantoinase B
VFATAAPDGFVAPPLAITKWGSEHPLIEAILSHEDAMSTFDAVTLEVLWNRLISIVDETGATLQRTSFSTIVRESNDFACVILDPLGRSLAQSVWSVPSFTGMLPITLKHMLKDYPAGTLEPGDSLITNDPWMGI